jgi:hypothetical protein
MISVFAAWMLAGLYWPSIITETYDPRLQDLSVCLEQVNSKDTWPMGRMSEDFKKEVMAGKAVLRPVFVGCYDDEKFKEEFKIFKNQAVDVAPNNKWWIIRASNDATDIGFAGQGPYTLEGCLADFYELRTGGDTLIAGCINDSVRHLLSDIAYHRFVKNKSND